MAYPDYSILVIETFNIQTQSVAREMHLFSNVNDANIAYKTVVQNAESRVFLFEQPQPTKFKRNDDVPVSQVVDTWGNP